ncbi:MAG: AI-2E family transporter [Methanosarcina sp.]|uniref:AI-2E family transporter n=1 Tax=Methanosarcina sp. TaxID=2213 RepID=UPI00261B2787|nr:AI-2E family transporter [Methanosarcina sp.]MDD3247150.1 AI-2E family transporter [Methanosarcina sp.]
MERSAKMVLALILILILTAVIAYAVLPFKNYFFSAFILFVIFRPLYHFLRKRARIGRSLASIFVIVISIFVVLIPLYFLLSVIVSETQQLLTDQESIIASIKTGGQLLTSFLSHLNIPQESLQTKIEEKVMGFVSDTVSFTSRFILGSIQSLSQQFVGLTIMYFLLYYLFTGENSSFMQKISVAIPFNEENTARLLQEFKTIVRTTLIATGAIALVQGGILTIVFLFFGIQGAFLWGSIAAILSFLPVVGAPFVWVPAFIIQLLQQDYTAGIGIFIAGLVISTVDNFLRPAIQNKVGAIHPFQSLLGIIIGISLFGLIGIVIGPLLLSYFILTVEMFSEEYLSDRA